MVKLGWNYEGQDLGSNKVQIVSELTSYRANWHLALGDEALAIKLLSHVDKGVIYRIFDPFGEWTEGSPFDNEFWDNHPPDSIIQHILGHYRHLLGYDNLVFSVGNNEPSTAGKTKEFVAWCVELADLGYKHGIRFAIAEIASAKSINHDEIKSGVWDDLINAMHVYRDFHIFTFHEYTTGILPATLLPNYPLSLNQPDALHHDNWKHAKLNLFTIEGNWHLGRGALITHVRAKQLGLEPLPFVITESAFDWMSDVIESDDKAVEAQRKAVVEPLRNAFKSAGHDALRGSTGHQMYHDWLINKTGFTGDWNDYLFAQYQWMVDAYPDECEGFCIFALNRDWDLPEGHDMSLPRNDKFRQLIITSQKEAPDMPTPIIFNPPLFDCNMHVSHGIWNLRADMTINSKPIALLDTTIRRMKVSKKTNHANGYDWYKFTMELSTGVLTGYFAHGDKLNFDFLDDTTDIPDVPDLPGLPEIEDMVQQVLAPLMETLLIDVPLPDFTMSIPAIMKDYLVSYHRAQAKMHEAIARRVENGTPTMTQVANEIYATIELSDVHATNISGLPDSSQLDILNGGTDGE